MVAGAELVLAAQGKTADQVVVVDLFPVKAELQANLLVHGAVLAAMDLIVLSRAFTVAEAAALALMGGTVDYLIFQVLQPITVVVAVLHDHLYKAEANSLKRWAAVAGEEVVPDPVALLQLEIQIQVAALAAQ